MILETRNRPTLMYITKFVQYMVMFLCSPSSYCLLSGPSVVLVITPSVVLIAPPSVVTPPSPVAPPVRIWRASASSRSEADTSWTVKPAGAGSLAPFSSGDLLVNGVQTPWTLGVSVCHVRRRRSVTNPDRVRTCSTHWQMAPLGSVLSAISSRPPFTGNGRHVRNTVL